MVRTAIASAVIAALMLGGCGTTYVVPSEQNARIYVDGAMVGRGYATIPQRGLPGRAQVLVTTDDGRRQQQSVRRSFTLVTFLLCFITYGVCWVACWEYPGTVMVAVQAPGGGYVTGAAPANDPWLQPPPGWQPHNAPAPK